MHVILKILHQSTNYLTTSGTRGLTIENVLLRQILLLIKRYHVTNKMIVLYSCIIHSNLFTSGTLDAGRRILELHLTRQLFVHVDCDIPHRKDVHFARNKV